jgi:translation initiation factor IF-2
MKTLTELSGSVVRVAAAAIAEARRSLPKEEEPAAPDVAAEAVAEPAAAEPAEAGPAQPIAAGPATAEPTAPADVAAAAAEPAKPAPKAAPVPKKAAPAPDSEAVKAILDEAVAKATGLSGDRLAMLRDALEAVGRRTEDVRLVRVFGADEQVPGATAIGGRQYVVDFFPASMRQVAGSPKDDRGRRGGGGGRGGGGRGGGGRGTAAGTTGGFSMDALRDDRKGGGRGRPGGGARPPRGGGPPGGRSGDPKK